MKTIVHSYPHSSFLSMEKDLNLIVNMIMKNENLKRMLHYTTRDCLSQPKLTDDDTVGLFGKNIKIIPKLYLDGSVLNYIIVNFNNFVTNNTNPEFRNNIIEFDIVCHFDQWQMKDFQLRPYRIAAEIDTMFNDKHLTGIGTLKFHGAKLVPLSSEYAGLCVQYAAIHGGEDSKKMPNPNDEERLIENYNQMFNN